MGVYRLTKQVQLYSIYSITNSGLLDIDDLVMICDKPRFIGHIVPIKIHMDSMTARLAARGALPDFGLPKEKIQRDIFIRVVGMTKEVVGYVLFDAYTHNAFQFIKPC